MADGSLKSLAEFKHSKSTALAERSEVPRGEEIHRKKLRAKRETGALILTRMIQNKCFGLNCARSRVRSAQVKSRALTTGVGAK